MPFLESAQCAKIDAFVWWEGWSGLRFTITLCFHMTSLWKPSVHIHNPSLILTIGEAIRKKRGFATRAEKIIEKAIDPKRIARIKFKNFWEGNITVKTDNCMLGSRGGQPSLTRTLPTSRTYAWKDNYTRWKIRRNVFTLKPLSWGLGVVESDI